MTSPQRDSERYAAGLGWLGAIMLSGVGFSASAALPFVARLGIGVALGLVAFAAIYFSLRGRTRRD